MNIEFPTAIVAENTYSNNNHLENKEITSSKPLQNQLDTVTLGLHRGGPELNRLGVFNSFGLGANRNKNISLNSLEIKENPNPNKASDKALTPSTIGDLDEMYTGKLRDFAINNPEEAGKIIGNTIFDAENDIVSRLTLQGVVRKLSTLSDRERTTLGEIATDQYYTRKKQELLGEDYKPEGGYSEQEIMKITQALPEIYSQLEESKELTELYSGKHYQETEY
ncbi:MAG: hypothetical protein MK033_02255 [Candidatus Caenarcaniphilales bacterium]|nr:hypothetical protein [Candidatus Caenarcaniphilales bacterium]